jgi:hypothetical protein
MRRHRPFRSDVARVGAAGKYFGTKGYEVRKNAQLACEVEFAIPREISQQQGVTLARDFVYAEFVNAGLIATSTCICMSVRAAWQDPQL